MYTNEQLSDLNFVVKTFAPKGWEIPLNGDENEIQEKIKKIRYDSRDYYSVEDHRFYSHTAMMESNWARRDEHELLFVLSLFELIKSETKKIEKVRLAKKEWDLWYKHDPNKHPSRTFNLIVSKYYKE
jgi:hypothetical protein